MSAAATGPLSPPQLELFQTKLDNGLTVVIQEDPATVLAAVNLWYDVGSRDEESHRTGFAHLFEHLMFQGSRNVKANEHFSFLEKFGAHVNATTSVDRTNYFDALPAEHLDLALWLEADRMGSLDVSQENLDNQIEVVKEEKRQRNDNQPAGSFLTDVLAALFPEGHPMRHAPIGSMEHLDAADLAYVQNFHKTYYGPNNAVLTVVSPLGKDAVLDRIKHYFGGIDPIPTPPPTRETAVATWALDAPVRTTIPDRVQAPILGLGFRVPPFGHPDHDALQLACAVLAYGRGSRLSKALTRDRQLVIGTSGFLQALDWNKGCSVVLGQAQVRPGIDPQEVIDVIEAECKRITVELPTEAELRRAKAVIAAAWTSQLSGVASRADNISAVATKTGDASQINHALDGLLAATSEDVARVAGECLSSDGNVILTYVPASAEEEAA